MKKFTWKIAVFALITGSFAGCKKPPSITKEEVMQQRIEERLDNWLRQYKRNCEQAVVDEATAIVDSTLLADARLKRDTSDRPSIPGRPGRPDFVPPDDSSEVKPLLRRDTGGE